MERGLEEMLVPDVVLEAQPAGKSYIADNLRTRVLDVRQQTCPFGFGVVQLADCAVGCEACEELWAPENPHTSNERYRVHLRNHRAALSYGA